MKVKCPTCSVIIDYKKSTYRPFCSENCKNIDMGHWLLESYVVGSESNNLVNDEQVSDHKDINNE